MKKILISLFIIMLFFTFGCSKVASVSGIDVPNDDLTTIQEQSNNGAIKGVVNYYDIEGGFWGLTDEGGQNYLLIDAKNNAYEDKKEYLVSGLAHPEWITFKMWGTPFEVTTASIVK